MTLVKEDSLSAQRPTDKAYHELQIAFDYYNARLFGDRLSPCLITLQREKNTRGYFSRNRFVHRYDREFTHEIAMNPVYFSVLSVEEVLSTLVHEMVHQWQYEYGKPGRRGYHNREWGEKMEAIGLMPSNTGKPGGARTGEQMTHYIIPDGRFAFFTKALLSSRFAISWVDRFPPKELVDEQLQRYQQPEEELPPQYTLDEEAMRLQAKALAQEAAFVEEFIFPLMPKPVSLEDFGEDTRTLQAPPIFSGFLEEVLEPNDVENRSLRVKYRCPSCYAQVWGKPKLKLRCGEEGCVNTDYIEL